MSPTSIRPDPQRAERNLRNAIRLFVPYQVPVYGQDVVDILGELERLRASAAPVLERVDQILAAAGGRRG